ncbi:hypothetical protein S40285_10927, partial [Stachybotrys chlorohalonatus IBT 40285]
HDEVFPSSDVGLSITSKPSPGNSSSDKSPPDSPTDNTSSGNSSTETVPSNSPTTEASSPNNSSIATPSTENQSSGDASDNKSLVYEKVHGNEDGNQTRKEVDIKREVERGMFVDDVNDINDVDYNNFYEPHDVEPAFSFPGVEPARDGATVGYAFSDRFRKYINRYGKRSVARYRLEKHAQDPKYDDLPVLPPKHWVSNAENRLGEKKTAQNKYVYKRCKILGVAWKTVGFGPSRRDLDLINPDNDPNYRSVPTYCLVKWETGDIRWETRATIAKIDMKKLKLVSGSVRTGHHRSALTGGAPQSLDLHLQKNKKIYQRTADHPRRGLRQRPDLSHPE